MTYDVTTPARAAAYAVLIAAAVVSTGPTALRTAGFAGLPGGGGGISYLGDFGRLHYPLLETQHKTGPKTSHIY